MHLAAIHLDVQLTITKGVEGDGLTRGGKLASSVLRAGIGQVSTGVQVLEIGVVSNLFKLPDVHSLVLGERGTNLHGEVSELDTLIRSGQGNGHGRLTTVCHRVSLSCPGGLISHTLIAKGQGLRHIMPIIGEGDRITVNHIAGGRIQFERSISSSAINDKVQF